VSLTLSRSIGSHFYGGNALVRGAGATVYEQSFDLLAAGLSAIASAFVIMTRGGAGCWLASNVVMAVAGFMLVSVGGRLMASVSRRRTPPAMHERGYRLHRRLAILGASPLLAPGIGRRLFALSILRFFVLALVLATSARAVPLDIPVWQLAAAMPFAIFATALALTPGGLGVNEWTMTAALFMLGTPIGISAQWAIVNRVLVALAGVACGFAGFAIAAVVRWSRVPQPR
jgi:uncharacterized membrane protein YbhN (UPF0104 family)